VALTLEPLPGEEYAAWREGVLERRTTHPRMRGITAERAAARARGMVDRHLPAAGPADGTEVLSVLDGDGLRVGGFFLLPTGGTTVQLGDLVLQDPADGPVVRELVVDRLVARGTRTLGVGVLGGDPAGAAFVDDPAFEVVATQMQLDLAGSPAPSDRLTVRPVTADELAAYFASAVEQFAEETMQADSSLTREEALENSRDVHDQILPEGLETPGHDFLVALDAEDGRRVGFTWLFHEDRAGFVYDVEVDEAERGRGYGRALMDRAADHMRDLGMEVLGLNVFGHNQVARSLYAALGYVVVDESFNLALGKAEPVVTG
jgi:ribosomal protein S18 acetylase RimI-like enzyme